MAIAGVVPDSKQTQGREFSRACVDITHLCFLEEVWDEVGLVRVVESGNGEFEFVGELNDKQI